MLQETSYGKQVIFRSGILQFSKLRVRVAMGQTVGGRTWPGLATNVCDNTSVASMSANPTHHARVKHVEIDHHFVREKVQDGTLQLNFVPSANQIADVLTKPITPKLFADFRGALKVTTEKDEELTRPGEC